MPLCQVVLKKSLIEGPIPKNPDLEKPYKLLTAYSKYAWECVLTQFYEHKVNGKHITIQHPITHQSALFSGSHLNWDDLTKEAYAIYMLIKT